jgi:hypothetical protein
MSKISSELTSEPISATAPGCGQSVSPACYLFCCRARVRSPLLSAESTLPWGLGSFAAAVGLTRLTGSFHADLIRIPMMVLALAGSLFTLYIVRRARVLRARPASQWRVRALSPKEKRKETFQIALSTLTILLIVAEFGSHLWITRGH